MFGLYLRNQFMQTFKNHDVCQYMSTVKRNIKSIRCHLFVPSAKSMLLCWPTTKCVDSCYKKNKNIVNLILNHIVGSWSYGSWTYKLPVQSVPITTKVVSSNPVDGEVYSIQHYVIKFVSDLRQVGGFLRVLWFPPSIKLIATILLKYC